MRFRTVFIALGSCFLLSSCGLFHGRHSGGHGHGNVNFRGGGNGPAALIVLGVGVAIGTIISAIPGKHTPIDSDRYYSDGVFYRDTPRGYEVIAPPVGVWVSELPAHNSVVRRQGFKYVECKGVWYRYGSQSRQYQVVANPYIVP
ncbi:MAG: DUF6515 family protein [Paraglaciecola polaris]|uniref:DUF6515 family protein n=1 Tax=Paraglaciecola polaris TaxID=222814 RepID=UPI003002F19C|tara:strand:- start:2844 stop:3278 length:435 start_codon:yes stop_codon:yes gene_type:complete